MAKIVFNKKHNTLFCNNCRAASTSCTAALTSAATWSTKTLLTSFANSNVCYIKHDFVVVRNLTCGEQAHMESAGTNSSTNFQSVACKDVRQSKLSKLWAKCEFEILLTWPTWLWNSGGRQHLHPVKRKPGPSVITTDTPCHLMQLKMTWKNRELAVFTFTFSATWLQVINEQFDIWRSYSQEKVSLA